MAKKKESKKRHAPKPKRKVLVILSNRWDRNEKAQYLELVCDPRGNILQEKKLSSAPKQPQFDEVWENDEGKSEFGACHRFSRKYGHKLEKSGKT